MFDSLQSLLNTRSIENEGLRRVVLVLRDMLKEERQLEACFTKRWLEIWRGKPCQAVHPIGIDGTVMRSLCDFGPWEEVVGTPSQIKHALSHKFFAGI
jgi:hypothetical protein